MGKGCCWCTSTLPWQVVLILSPRHSLCSAKNERQALLVAAATCSALEALLPAACSLGVHSPAFSVIGPWLSHPNAVRNSPIMLRQLLKLGVLALERWLQARWQRPIHYLAAL